MPDEPHRGHEAQAELFRLLGVGHHASTDDLRLAYDQAMTRATRAGDLAFARQLNAAYEALPVPRRNEVFGRNFRTSMHADDLPPASGTVGTPVPRSRPPARPRPDRKWGMSRPIRILAYTVLLPATALAGLGMWRTYTSANTPTFTGGTPPPAAPTSKAAEPANGSRIVTWRIPANTPVNSEGWVLIMCVVPAPPSSSGYTFPARPGSLVTCTNGATPQIVG